MTEKYEVFISYRRKGGDSLGLLISDRLSEQYGYNVFYDVETMRAGNFNEQIYNVIDECSEVVVILPPNALDRCEKENDWLRLEIEYAIAKRKNIIPIMMRGFTWPEKLPDSMKDFPLYNGITASMDYFDASIEKLVNLFTIQKTKKNSKNVELQENEKTKFLKYLRSISIEEFLNVYNEIQEEHITAIDVLNQISKNRKQEEIFNMFNNILTEENMRILPNIVEDSLIENLEELNIGVFADLIRVKHSNNELRKLALNSMYEIAGFYYFIKQREKEIDAKSKNIAMTNKEYIQFIFSITKEEYDNAKKLLETYEEEQENLQPIIQIINDGIKEFNEEGNIHSKTIFEEIKKSINLLLIIANMKKEYKLHTLIRELTFSFIMLVNTNKYMELYLDMLGESYIVEQAYLELQNAEETEISQLMFVIMALCETTNRMDLYGIQYDIVLKEKLNETIENYTVEKFRKLLSLIDIRSYVEAENKLSNIMSMPNNGIMSKYDEGLFKIIKIQAMNAQEYGDMNSVEILMMGYRALIKLVYILDYKGVKNFEAFVRNITLEEFRKITFDAINNYAQENGNYLGETKLLKYANNETLAFGNDGISKDRVYMTLLVQLELILKNRKNNHILK